MNIFVFFLLIVSSQAYAQTTKPVGNDRCSSVPRAAQKLKGFYARFEELERKITQLESANGQKSSTLDTKAPVGTQPHYDAAESKRANEAIGQLLKEAKMEYCQDGKSLKTSMPQQLAFLKNTFKTCEPKAIVDLENASAELISKVDAGMKKQNCP